MNTNRLLFAAALVAPLAAFAPQLERIAFKPAAGTSLSKTFEVKQSFTMEEAEIKVNGSIQQKPQDAEMSMSMQTSVALTDVYAAIDGGRVTRLERKYDALTGTGNMTMDMGAFGNSSRDLKLESELEGQTVVFEWDAEKRTYVPRFGAKEGASELLIPLVEDFDLRGFVPAEGVEVGAVWKVDVVALRNVLAPGTGHSLRPERGSAERMTDMVQQNMDFAALFEGSAARTLEARFEGLREAGGRRLAVIALSGKVHAQHDATEEARKGITQPTGGGDSVPEIQKVTVDVQIELRGELEWDLDGGHARSLRLNGTERLQQSVDLLQDFGGSRVRIEDGSTLSGPFDVVVEFQRNG
ncbi:MAG: hypothetical protein IT453_04925 [Planctomycetes bacterium]|nr:hypothetical protein [Planctomycetota bacterium]